MWWFSQLIACAACGVKHGLMRVHGWSWWMFLLMVAFFVVIEGGFWVSMQTAKASGVAFFRVWFLGTACLATFGLVVSLFYFRESMTPVQMIGMICAVAGAFLLIKG